MFEGFAGVKNMENMESFIETLEEITGGIWVTLELETLLGCTDGCEIMDGVNSVMMA